MNRLILLVTALVTAAYVSGCGCTELGCDNRLVVTAGQALPARYDVAFTIDGTTSVAACDLESADASEAPIPAVVTGDPDFYAECSADKITLFAAPEKVTVSFVDEMGTTIAEKTFEPSYAEESPNGERCGPTCESTEVAM